MAVSEVSRSQICGPPGQAQERNSSSLLNLNLPPPTAERATSRGNAAATGYRTTGTAAARWHSPSAARTRQSAPAATGSSINVDQVGYYDTPALLAETCTPAHTHPELLLLRCCCCHPTARSMLHVRAALTAEKASLDIKKVCLGIPDWLLHLDLLAAQEGTQGRAATASSSVASQHDRKGLSAGLTCTHVCCDYA